MPKALITGCSGQDGSFLADILLERGYDVYGLVRRSSGDNRRNIHHLRNNRYFTRIEGDVTDPIFMSKVLNEIEPDHLYHEADQDHVGESFNTPAYSMEVTVKAVTNILEICKEMVGPSRPRIFLPSSATIFGDAPAPQDEKTPLNPQSPYAVGKAAVLHLGNLYRSIYGLRIVTGILYNHDSDRRNGSYFLHDVCKIALECSLKMRKDTGDRFSDTEAEINIGEARKYMEVVVQLMEKEVSDNFVIGTSQSRQVESWIRLAFTVLGLNYREFLIRAYRPNRPGNPELYCPNTSKLEKQLGQRGITTDYSALVSSIIEKYRKESQS